jgi:hypothetical protein
MKRTAVIFTICLALALAASAADLRPWTPPDSQVVLEIADLGAIRAELRQMGLEEDLTGLVRRWTSKHGAPDEDPWASLPPPEGVSVLLAVGGLRLDGPPGPMHGRLALGFPTTAAYEAFRARVLPAEALGVPVSAVGPFRIYSKPAAEAEGLRSMACGENTIVMAWGEDLSKAVAAYVAGAPPAAAPAQADPLVAGRGLPPPQARLHVDLASLGMMSDAAVARMIHKLQAPSEGPAGDATNALRSMLARIPEEKMNEFVTGLDLDMVRTLDAAFYRDGGRCLASVALGLAGGDGGMPAYVDSLRARRMQVLPLLPADTLVVSDGVGDPAGFFRRLQAHAARTMGPQGETAFMALELAAQVKFGLSFSGQILPLLGGEWGMALVPLPAAAGEPPARPAAVLFCVPEDAALLAPALKRLGETGAVTAQPEGAPDSHQYSLTLGKEPGAPVRWHLLARDGALFLTDRPAVFDRIGARGPRLAAPPAPPAAPGQNAPVVLHYAAGLSALPVLLEPLQRLLPEPAGTLAGAGTDAGAGPAFHEALLTESALVFHSEMPWAVFQSLGRAFFEGARAMRRHAETEPEGAAR